MRFPKKKRKAVDLSEEVIKSLKTQAAPFSLKPFMEKVLIDQAIKFKIKTKDKI